MSMFSMGYLVNLVVVFNVRFEPLNLHYLEDLFFGGEGAAKRGKGSSEEEDDDNDPPDDDHDHDDDDDDDGLSHGDGDGAAAPSLFAEFAFAGD